MNVKQALHDMVASDSYSSQEWERADQIRHLLPASAYTSQEWFDREQRELFGTSWTFAGMTEDVKAPGDYKCVDVGSSALVLMRDLRDRLVAFHNVCRHRGARLLEGSGNIPGESLVCFYHKWTYNLADELKLIAVPFQREVYPDLDKSCYALRPAKVATWKNLVFLHPDADAEPFGDWLSKVPQELGPFEPGQTEIHDPARLVEVSDVVYRVRANWKIIVENFIDGYHLPLLHAASLSTGDFSLQRWRPAGRHQAFYRPLKPSVAAENAYTGQYGDRPWPVIDGVPERYGASYQWLFPNLGLFQTATSWSTFHVIPVTPDASLVQSRVRAEPIDRMPAEENLDPQDLPPFIVSAKGCSLGASERRSNASSLHPLESRDVMREDIYACESIQRSMRSSAFAVGPLSRWEAPLTHFQQRILDCVPLRP